MGRRVYPPRENGGLVGAAKKREFPLARAPTARIPAGRRATRGRPPLGLAQRCRIFLDVVEKHAYFRHLAIEELVNEAELLRSRQAIIGEMADVLPEAGVRIRIARTGGDGHGARRKQAEQPWACPAAANLATGARLKITVEHRGRRPTKGRLRRKAIDHRHVFEN